MMQTETYTPDVYNPADTDRAFEEAEPTPEHGLVVRAIAAVWAWSEDRSQA